MPVPEGRLGIELFDDEFIQDPYLLYDRMRTDSPIHRIGDAGFYAVCTWDAVNEAIARPQDFSSNLTATMTYQDGQVRAFPVGELGADIQALATADDPAHAIHRKLLLPHLSARRINELERFVGATADRLWNDGVDDAGCIEWMSAMANRLPMMIVMRLIGVPDVDSEQLVQWGYASTQVVEGLVDADQLESAGVAIMQLSGYIIEHLQRAAAKPRNDLISTLATACAAGELAQITALNMMITLFSAGGESTASLIGTAAQILARRPDVQQRLRSDPELLGPFLEEALRYEPPFRGHYRHVVNDTELCGVELAAGSRLVLLWGAANRDPRHFVEPNEFRLDRPQGKGHISFGKGAHFCVGAALARLEARIVIGELLKRTSHIEAAAIGRWLPSLLVRRLERLQLALT
ncbi:cytochrome P450 [Mycolicibacterium agri]|uniref:Cytochrome P450 n=1 Tax=Mycolicibacterium agri TaxID=36811 RepID=A0A2A7MYI1_MYCAG|nr:cytochrome P450 [Mycolicibacterium agri]PEG36795.1 cytochrome P450 [Mycolicibacterium agri]GFG50726.1 cytochrome P450 144 [Mycolicibacterium agri]